MVKYNFTQHVAVLGGRNVFLDHTHFYYLYSMQLIAFATALSLFASFWVTSTFATPVKEARSIIPNAMCNPNFEGVGISVTSSAQEWGTSPASVPHAPIINFSHRGPMLVHPDFRFEQNGRHPPQYIVKDISHGHLVASVRDNKLLLLNEQRDDLTQLWHVVCRECTSNVSQSRGYPVATSCNITSVGAGWCVTNSGVLGDTLFLSHCDGSDRQRFDFWTPTRL